MKTIAAHLNNTFYTNTVQCRINSRLYVTLYMESLVGFSQIFLLGNFGLLCCVVFIKVNLFILNLD